MTDHSNTNDEIANKKIELAAENIRHLLNIREEQASLQIITDSLLSTLRDTQNGVPDDFSAILAAQVRVLDATFHFYVNKAQNIHTQDDKINIALRAQRQTERTISAWKKLAGAAKNKNTVERTEQNAPLDR